MRKDCTRTHKTKQKTKNNKRGKQRSLTRARDSFTTWASSRLSLSHFVVYRQLLPIPTPDDPRRHRHYSRPRDSAKAPVPRPPAACSWTLRNRSPGTSEAPDTGTQESDPKPRTSTEARVRNQRHFIPIVYSLVTGKKRNIVFLLCLLRKKK